MKTKLLILSISLLTANTDYWHIKENQKEDVHQHEALTISMDAHYIKDALKNAPLVSPKINLPILLNFPTPAGEYISFEIVETPVMPEKLAKKFPTIRTYTGKGIENPGDRVSVTVYNSTVKVLMIGSKGSIHIGLKRDGSGDYLTTFNESDLTSDTIEIPHSDCGSRDVIHREPDIESSRDDRGFPYCVGESEPCFDIGNTLVTFRYAGILTAEANNAVADGTVAGGLAWIASMANQINLLWVRELSCKLQLIENSDLIIYNDDNPTPEAFTYFDMYTELPNILGHLNATVGYGGYGTAQVDLTWEYGAVFNTGYGGGLAYVPGSTSANLPYYDIHNHEIGHNLGSSHNCTVEGGWRSTFGGTAMCNRTNTLPGSYGNQYSSHTIDIAIRYQNEPFGGSSYDYQKGWLQETMDNNIPNVELTHDMITIPKDTPFVLEGYGEDMDENNQFTYSWEPNDVTDVAFSPPDYPEDSGPLFCSLDGKIDGNIRYFPVMTSLLNNQYSTGNIERLPFAGREMNMRLLVRDNDLLSGGFNYKNVHITVDENAGPFRVTSQSEALNWETGSTQQITWDIANTTNLHGVNSSLLHIYLSVDGGENFDILLAEDIPNNGSYYIIVPQLPSLDNCRIMVKSADNIFFDINQSYFSIVNTNMPELGIDESSIELSYPHDTENMLDVEIQNVGDEGSYLVYDVFTELYLNGDGYLTFDGVDDYVDLGANMLSGNGDFSISLWVKTQDVNAVIIQQRNGGFNGEYQLHLNNNGQIAFWTYHNGYHWSVTSPESFNDDNWHHVVMVQDGLLNGGRIYVDGVERDYSSDGITYLDPAIHTALGADTRDNGNYLNGAINDVQVYHKALSQSVINTLFDYGFGFNPTYNHDGFNASDYLVAYYPMTAMTGETLIDEAQNGHDGVLVGPEWSGDHIPIPNWMTVTSESSWLSMLDTEMIQVGVSTYGLNIGSEYMANIIVVSNAETESVTIPIHLQVLDNGLQGDLDGNGSVNVLDVILVVNIVLAGEYTELADLNNDGNADILDVVLMVNIILEV